MTKDLDRKVAQAMGLKSVNNCEEWSNSNMKDLDRKVPWSQELESVWAEKDPEDEAFEELALKQGQWHHESGWRKKQIAHMDVHSHPAEFVHLHRNDTIEEIAKHLETKFTGPFGRDTVQSFATFIRSMKR